MINIKISEGKTILQELGNIRECSDAAVNVVYYFNEEVERYRKRINKWQLKSKEILSRAFGETHSHTITFEDTIS